MRPCRREQAHRGEQRAVELFLGEEVNCVLAVVAINLLICDHRDFPAGTVHKSGFALAVHLHEVRFKKPAVFGVDDDDHPSLLTSAREASMRESVEVVNTPNQGYSCSAWWHGRCTLKES
jgi:hypothetical protein